MDRRSDWGNKHPHFIKIYAKKEEIKFEGNKMLEILKK